MNRSVCLNLNTVEPPVSGKTLDPKERLKLSLELHVAKSRYTGLLTNYLARGAGKLAVF